MLKPSSITPFVWPCTLALIHKWNKGCCGNMAIYWPYINTSKDCRPVVWGEKGNTVIALSRQNKIASTDTWVSWLTLSFVVNGITLHYENKIIYAYVAAMRVFKVLCFLIHLVDFSIATICLFCKTMSRKLSKHHSWQSWNLPIDFQLE